METMAHRYTVELRVYGKTLDPDLITRETGLVPCQTRLAGARVGGRTYSTAMWAFNGIRTADTSNWDALEEGLVFILDHVSASHKLFASYRAVHRVVWWCGHFQSVFDGGPVLSPALLGRLGAFGAELFIDNYFSNR